MGLTIGPLGSGAVKWGLRRALARLAAEAPVPVFPAVGRGAREAVEALRLVPELELVDTPRHATVLLVAGCVPGALVRPLLRIHDQLTEPRATVWWTPGASGGRLHELLPQLSVVAPEGDVIATILRRQRALLGGDRASEPPVQPDIPPHPWRGVGPYGQGGKGMTGGFPYGRSLAKRAPARDGLELDQVPVRIGPFFPPFPPGLMVEVKLQGDIVQDVVVGKNPFKGASAPPLGEPTEATFVAALAEAVSIAALELARVRHHLRWVAHALRVHGLEALGLRALRLAVGLRPADAPNLLSLRRLLARTRLLRSATAGIGRIEPARLAGLGAGPVARAAGLAEDARAHDAAYRTLGFEPVLQKASDARARWQQRLAEAVQSLDLAARAGDRVTTIVGRVEAPRGLCERGSYPGAELLPLLPDLLTGQEWGDAVTTVVSLDLDLEEATPIRAAG